LLVVAKVSEERTASLFFTLKMEITSSSETLVNTYKATWRHNIQYHNLIFAAMKISNLKLLLVL
jgi:hypothetical protein